MLGLFVAVSALINKPDTFLTPGGLGIREAAVLGGAALIGISPDVAAGVALIDRLFMIVITAVFTVPAVFILGTHKPTQS